MSTLDWEVSHENAASFPSVYIVLIAFTNVCPSCPADICVIKTEW